jgi:prepilin peptidase CpaA
MASETSLQNGDPTVLTFWAEFSGEAVLPALISAGVALCFIRTAMETPLPQTLGTAAFLLIAVFSDVQSRRIPNWLTFSALAAALGCAFLIPGGTSGVMALAGSALALVIFGVPFAFGWLGAGDVKACMVLGALWGPSPLAGAAGWMVVCGGLLAIVIVALRRGGLKDLVKRWSMSAWYTLRLGRLVYLQPGAGSAAAGGLPFAVAMGIGASAFQILGSPWL